jgi:hypothetical protein
VHKTFYKTFFVESSANVNLKQGRRTLKQTAKVPSSAIDVFACQGPYYFSGQGLMLGKYKRVYQLFLMGAKKGSFYPCKAAVLRR